LLVLLVPQGPRGGWRPSARGGDKARRGEVRALPRRCSLLLAPQWQWWRRGPGMAAVTMGSQRRRQQWGPGSGGVCSNRLLGGPAAAACEGNENLPSDFRPQAGPKFIGSSISSGSTWNRC
jgi:hypothetical protein